VTNHGTSDDAVCEVWVACAGRQAGANRLPAFSTRHFGRVRSERGATVCEPKQLPLMEPRSRRFAPPFGFTWRVDANYGNDERVAATGTLDTPAERIAGDHEGQTTLGIGAFQLHLRHTASLLQAPAECIGLHGGFLEFARTDIRVLPPRHNPFYKQNLHANSTPQNGVAAPPEPPDWPAPPDRGAPEGVAG